MTALPTAADAGGHRRYLLMMADSFNKPLLQLLQDEASEGDEDEGGQQPEQQQQGEQADPATSTLQQLAAKQLAAHRESALYRWQHPDAMESHMPLQELQQRFETGVALSVL